MVVRKTSCLYQRQRQPFSYAYLISNCESFPLVATFYVDNVVYVMLCCGVVGLVLFADIGWDTTPRVLIPPILPNNPNQLHCHWRTKELDKEVDLNLKLFTRYKEVFAFLFSEIQHFTPFSL